MEPFPLPAQQAGDVIIWLGAGVDTKVCVCVFYGRFSLILVLFAGSDTNTSFALRSGLDLNLRHPCWESLLFSAAWPSRERASRQRGNW